MTIYATYDRSIAGNADGYRVSLRTSDNLDDKSEIVEVASLDAAHAYLTERGATYVKNFKAARVLEGSARLDTPALAVDDEDVGEDNQPPGARAPRGRVTRIQDPKRRAAVERRSLDVALDYYKDIGGQNPRELGKPYDIAVTVGGVERHCEVKGSTMLIDTCELTINEVNHASDYDDTDLIVVDGIATMPDETTGEFVCFRRTDSRLVWDGRPRMML